MTPHPNSATYKASKMQSYLVKHYNSEENEPWVYHTQFSYLLKIANLSLPLLFKAIYGVLSRHPILRTTFCFTENNQLCQTINSELKSMLS
jgi:hypothetical protein